jgi:hypothetical protein
MSVLSFEDDPEAGPHRLSAGTRDRNASSPAFRAKDPATRLLINQALDQLDSFGVPMTGTGRRRECMAMAFIAVAGVKPKGPWCDAKDFEQGRVLKSRDIIDFRNRHLGENGSSGSYDDVRRRDLKPLVAAGIVVNSLPGSAHNAPNRAYALHPEFARAVRAFGRKQWKSELDGVLANRKTLRDQLSSERRMRRVPITLASGVELDFGPGEHNKLQKAVVEAFLPRYGYEAEVLYVGDAEDKDAHYDEERLRTMGVFALDHKELPDVIAFSEQKDWLYIIEAVTSAGPIDAYRHAVLQRLLEKVICDGVVYVTAFPDRGKAFRRYVGEISWETEVWVASDPDHLIHFDGERFLGPYGRRS